MSVFLRWGIFGIIGFAALMYAYNASKRLAEKHSPPPAVVSEAATAEPARENAAEPELAPVTASPVAPHCQTELVVAQRALDARREGVPLDRLLRIQEIAFEEPPRRALLEHVATSWYQRAGDEPTPEALRIAVVSDCMRFSPAP
jgi:hypothetical protein